VRRCLPVLAALLAATPAPPVEREAFLRFFDATVFGADVRGAAPRDRVLKATTAMPIEVYGEDAGRWLPFIAAYASELSALTGLDVTARMARGLRDIRDGEHIQLHIVPRSEFLPLVSQGWIPAEWRGGLVRSFCFFVTFGRETVRAALVVVDRELTDETLRHCLLEETAQAFGVVNDSTLMGASIFNDRGPLMSEPAEVDRLVLRVLYDPRLVPGMPREAALAEAGKVYDELTAAAGR
jgi:hypothetical protein